jgi:membrane-bound ClpP family serine protease
MTLTAIIILIILGILLLLVEFLIVPGITIAGIGGFVLMIGGIIAGYTSLGPPVAHYILLGTIFLNIVTFAFAFKQKTWEKAGLQQTISSKVNVLDLDLEPGMEGKTISRITPVGKALINDKIYEVSSYSGMIEANKAIKITQIKHNKIIIKQI